MRGGDFVLFSPNKIWVPSSQDWQNLGAPLQGLPDDLGTAHAPSPYIYFSSSDNYFWQNLWWSLPQNIGKIWVSSLINNEIRWVRPPPQIKTSPPSQVRFYLIVPKTGIYLVLGNIHNLLSGLGLVGFQCFDLKQINAHSLVGGGRAAPGQNVNARLPKPSPLGNYSKILLEGRGFSIFTGKFWESPLRIGRIWESHLRIGRILESPLRIGRIWEFPLKIGRIWESHLRIGRIWESHLRIGRIWESPLRIDIIWVLTIKHTLF